MTPATDVTRWILQLADPDPEKRSTAAMRLYMEGSNLCTPLLRQWIADPEFRELSLPSAPAPPGAADSAQPSTVVGIAVEPETFQKIRQANNFPPLADVPPEQDAMEFELRFEDHIELDILTTREPGGPGAIAQISIQVRRGHPADRNLCSRRRSRHGDSSFAIWFKSGVSANAPGC